MFQLPWRVLVNPYGKSKDRPDEDNIFIVDATGINVCIIAKHPVWNHLSNDVRLKVAEEIVNQMNKEMP